MSLLEYNIEDRVEEDLEYKNQNVFIYWTSNTSLLEYNIEDRVEDGLANAVEEDTKQLQLDILIAKPIEGKREIGRKQSF
jgi:hypothetical protein